MSDRQDRQRQISVLQSQLDALDEQLHTLATKRTQTAIMLAGIRAAKDGIKIGTIIIVPWGSDKTFRRYEVTHIKPHYNDDYRLYGVHIRVDGTKASAITELWQQGIEVEKGKS